MKTKCLLIAILTLGFNWAQASTALRGKCLSPSQKQAADNNNKGIETDFTHLQFLNQGVDTTIIDSTDVAQAIPMRMRPTNDGMAVEANIARHWGNNIVKSDFIKNNALARKVTQWAKQVEEYTSLSSSSGKKEEPAKKPASVEKKADTKVAEKKAVSKNSEAPTGKLATKVIPEENKKEEIVHKVDFRVQAVKKEARIIYKGFLDSSVTYFQEQQNWVFQAQKAITPTTVLSVTHQDLPRGTVDTVNFSYRW